MSTRKQPPTRRTTAPAAVPSLRARAPRTASLGGNRVMAALFRMAKGACPECEEERAKSQLQRKAGPGREPGEVPAVVYDVLRAPGRPLEEGVRTDMENRFGSADFSGVRIHTDSRAAESAEAVNAQAYTVGQDIVFGSDSSTASNRDLLTHELVHTLQQSTATVPARGLRVGEPTGAEEIAADQIAARASRGETPSSTPAGHSDQLQRRVGDPTQIPPGLTCPAAVTMPPNPILDVFFRLESAAIGAADVTALQWFVTNWQALGSPTPIRVDGFASTDGPESLNWRLSCERAFAVATELTAPRGLVTGVPSDAIELFAHGETDEFSATSVGPNRRVTISAPLSAPPEPEPPAPPTPPPGPTAGTACFDGTTVTVTKNGRSHSCPAITDSSAPTPSGTYCVRRQGEAQSAWRPWRDHSSWYLLEPQFPTTRSRMHLHPGSISEGCVTVTDGDCFDNLAEILNQTGTTTGTGYDGYPPGNSEGVTNPVATVDCVATLEVRSGGGCTP